MGEIVRQYQLIGLKTIEDAIKIENELKKVTQLDQVSVDYMNENLNISAKKISKSLFTKMKAIIKMIDEDIMIHKKKPQRIFLSTALFIFSLLLFTFYYFFQTQDVLSTVFFIASLVISIILLFYPQENFFSKFYDWQERIFVFIVVIVLLLVHSPFFSILIVIMINGVNLFEHILYTYKYNKQFSMTESMLFANMKRENHVVRVPIKEVQVDDIIYVKPSEKIPVDGIIIDGKSHVMYDQLNPHEKQMPTHLHMEVYGGMLNIDGVIAIQVTHDFMHSKWIQMEEFVRDCSLSSVRTVEHIKKCILVYKMMISILLLLVISIFLIDPQSHISFFLICSLLLLSRSGFIVAYILLYWNIEWNHLKQKGILVRGIEPLDLLSRIKHIIFDLEHTMTYGRDIVAKVVNHTRYSDEELLYYVACAEEYSINPVALAIKHSYKKRIQTNILSNYQELSGLGVKVNVEKQTVLVGNEKLLTKFGVWVEEQVQEIGTVLHIAIDQEYAGYIVVRDEMKPDVMNWLNKCRKCGFRHIKVISSESENFVTMVCQKLGISNYLSHLSLSDKNRALERYRFEEKKSFAFVSNYPKLLADHHADLNIMMKSIDDDFCHDAEILIYDGNDLEVVKKTANRLRKQSWIGIILFLLIHVCSLLLLLIGWLPIYFIPMIEFIFDCFFILFYRKRA